MGISPPTDECLIQLLIYHHTSESGARTLSSAQPRCRCKTVRRIWCVHYRSNRQDVLLTIWFFQLKNAGTGTYLNAGNGSNEKVREYLGIRETLLTRKCDSAFFRVTFISVSDSSSLQSRERVAENRFAHRTCTFLPAILLTTGLSNSLVVDC